MTKWIIEKINNKYSKYDFRLTNDDNNFSDIDFSKYNILRILVSLSSYLTGGIIVKNSDFYKISYDKKIPAIFNFSIDKTSDNSRYLTLNQNLTKIIFVSKEKSYQVETLTNNNTKVFSSLYLFESVNNLAKFFKSNRSVYNFKQNSNKLYLLTGWLNLNEQKYVILDLLKEKNGNSILTRCKIFDSKIIEKIDKLNKKIKSYCLFLVKINSDYNFEIKTIIPMSFDEYVSYLYDLMLPYKYNFDDNFNTKSQLKEYKSNDIERIAFAIDPDGSKDRDDAIAAFYLNSNKITFDIKNATHIKLKVHISNTLSYIYPSNSNYYYHYSKYKCNTDYLDKYNLPMMDRLLSENYLSLDGDNKEAITINMIYKITNNKKFKIESIPEKVYLEKSINLKIIGTTYLDFAKSFNLKPEKYFDNSNFIKRNIINCNTELIRDYNQFIFEGSSSYKDENFKLIANNLKQLYIYFVNSLNHTGKDSLIKLPSNLVRHTVNKKENIYLDFSPIDMWSHSLIEYTALESNIYFAYFMHGNINDLYLPYAKINLINNKLGETNLKLLLDNITSNKKVKGKKTGIYRNLYNPNNKVDYYINNKIKLIILKIWKKLLSKNKKSIYQNTINKFLSNYNYSTENKITSFLKLILALRQMLLLFDVDTNLDVFLNLISDSLKMKAAYSYFPFSHYDICTLLYTHATSPMRRFVDINVHNIIFNNNRENYIFRNIDLTRINSAFNTGKYIKQLVNEYRFSNFVEINNNLVTTFKLIDKKTNSIGFPDLNNFFKFQSLNNLNMKEKLIKLEIDNYDIPRLENTNKTNIFNIYYHMLSKEEKELQKYCKYFLRKIFYVKKIKNIC